MKILFLMPTYDGRCASAQRWPLFASMRELEAVGHSILGFGEVRGLLDDARNRLLSGALQREKADVAIWLDDDIVWRDNNAFCRLVAALEHTGAALVAANGPRQDGKPAAIHPEGFLAHWDYQGPVVRAGLSIAAADLRWYRRHWRTAPWFQTIPQTDDIGALMAPLGEDYFHSDAILRRGGSIQCLSLWQRNGDAEQDVAANWMTRTPWPRGRR